MEYHMYTCHHCSYETPSLALLRQHQADAHPHTQVTLNKDILQLAEAAGALHDGRGSVGGGTLRFTQHALDDFLRRFVEHQFEQIGEVKEDCNGHPWKRLAYTSEHLLAAQPLKTKVYARQLPNDEQR